MKMQGYRKARWKLTKEAAREKLLEHIHDNMADHQFEEELYDQESMLNVQQEISRRPTKEEVEDRIAHLIDREKDKERKRKTRKGVMVFSNKEVNEAKERLVWVEHDFSFADLLYACEKNCVARPLKCICCEGT